MRSRGQIILELCVQVLSCGHFSICTVCILRVVAVCLYVLLPRSLEGACCALICAFTVCELSKTLINTLCGISDRSHLCTFISYCLWIKSSIYMFVCVYVYVCWAERQRLKQWPLLDYRNVGGKVSENTVSFVLSSSRWEKYSKVTPPGL